MKPKQTISPSHSRNPAAKLFCLLAFVASAHAQPVIVAPQAAPLTLSSPTEGTTDTNELDNATTGLRSPSGSAPAKNKNPFQWGRVTLHPKIGYGFTYGTGVQSQPGNSHRTLIQTVTPGIGFDLGEHWQLAYSAAATFYSDANFQDSLSHNISLNGHTSYEDWGFRISQNVSITSDPQVETARQTDRQAYSTAAGVTYQINSDFFFDLTGNMNLSDTGGGFTNAVHGTRDWSGMAWLNYQAGPGVVVGVGAGYGYNSVETGINMTHQDYQSHLSWRVGRKLTLSLNGGAQVRQFVDSDQPSLVTPVFGAGLYYQLFPHTSLSLSASRTVSASDYFINQVTESTGFNAGISQRLFGNYNLGLSGGYVNTSYRASIGALSAAREDNYSFYSISLGRSFLKHGNASISYSKSQNSSSGGGFGYSSDQIGFQMDWGY